MLVPGNIVLALGNGPGCCCRHDGCLLENARIGNALGDRVRGDQEDEVDQGIEQADGGRIRILAVNNTDLVGVGRDDLGGRHIQRILHQVDLVETHVEHGTHVHDEQDRAGRHDRRQVDVTDQLQTAGAIDLRGLVQRGVHTGERGQVDDGVPADVLPDFGDPVDGGDGAGGAHQRFVAEEAAQDAGARGQEDVEHRDDDHHGDEVGHVGDGLYEALDFLGADLVDEQGQNDREDEAHDQRPQGDANGVGHDLAE